MPERSPELWRVTTSLCRLVILDDEGRQVLVGGDGGLASSLEAYGRQVADLDRVVACVNALAGVPDECLKGAGKLLEELLGLPREVVAADSCEQPWADLLGVYLNAQRKNWKSAMGPQEQVG